MDKTLYTILGLSIGLTIGSMSITNQFSKAFASKASRIYQMGCARGAMISKDDTGPRFERCDKDSSTFGNVLEQGLDQ